MKYHIIGLVQDCSFFYANELDILQSYTKPSLSIVGYRLILEQLERLRSENTPHCLMITHTIESYWTVKRKQSQSCKF